MDSADYLFHDEVETSQAWQRQAAPGTYRTKRPHKKSRAGCFPCKARRVKCPENLPICNNCKNKELECIYPSKVEQQLVRRKKVASTYDNANYNAASTAVLNGRYVGMPKFSLSSSPMNFSGDDMRFFHQFLSLAYPHLPLGSEEAWIMNVPLYAHESPMLMHAILSLGATHLTLIAPLGKSHMASAIAHRGHAIRGLNEMLTKNSFNLNELNAMLAACYTLAFQSHFLPDGMVDFCVMIRGCALVAQRLAETYGGEMIFSIHEDDQRKIAMKLLPATPCVDDQILEKYYRTLELVKPLLRDDAHHQFYRALVDTLNALHKSSRLGYTTFTQIYAVFYKLDNREFVEFVSDGNLVSQLLFVHFIAIHTLMVPVLVQASPERVRRFPQVTTAVFRWGEKVYGRLPASLRKFVQWQVELIESTLLEVRENCGLHPGLDFATTSPFSLEGTTDVLTEDQACNNTDDDIRSPFFHHHPS